MTTATAEIIAPQHRPIGWSIDQASDRKSIQIESFSMGRAPDTYVYFDPVTWCLTRPTAEGYASADIHTSPLEASVRRSYWRSSSLSQIFSDRVTEELGKRTEPHRQFIAEVINRNRMAWRNRRAYECRIDALRADAELDDLTINAHSERDFWDFMRSAYDLPKAMLALMENGDIRAVWKGSDSSHIGLHFLGHGEVQYVIFKRRLYSRRVSRVAGIDDFGGIKRQIVAFDVIASMNR